MSQSHKDVGDVEPGDLSFITLCQFWQAVLEARRGAAKKTHLDRFMQHNLKRPSDDLFSVMRLLMPQVSSSKQAELLQQCLLCYTCGSSSAPNLQHSACI